MVWPGYMANNHYTSTTNSSFSQPSDTLSGSGVIEQYFVPQYSHLYGIQFVVNYDEDSIYDENCTFQLCSEDGKVICEKNIPISEIQPNLYYEVSAKRILNTNKTYCWKLILPPNAPKDFHVFYSEESPTIAVENQKMIINDRYINETAQTVSQYIYLSHSDKALIIGTYWFMGVIVYLILAECINRFIINKNVS